MGDALGGTLPFAAGIALSPFPIAAVILVLLSPNARRSGVAFAAGWMGGLLVIGGLMLGLSDATEAAGSGGSESTLSGVVKLVLGAALLGAAARKWRERPGPGDEPQLPRWMRAFESATPPRSFALAAGLSANPKNLAFLLAATATISASSATFAEHVATLVVFVLLASAGAVVPVVAYFAMGERAETAMPPVRDWMLRNNAAVLATIFVIFGVKLVGDAVAILA